MAASDTADGTGILGGTTTGLDLLDDDPFEGITFSDTLEAAIADVMPSEDELDRADFNATAYINKMFPTEESLLSVDPFMEDLRAKITTLDKEIMDTVRLQTTGSASAQHELEGGKAAVQELFQRVQQIKSKAADSEAMVAEICRDIKSLDHAKRNLTVTITALKRLQMLSSAVQQLAAMTESRRYREAAHLLGAVNQLAVNFEGYRGIAKVDDLVRTIDGIKSDLRKRIFDDVNRLSTGGGQEDGAGGGGGGGGDAGPEGAAAGPGSIDHLADACAAVDALGEGVRREMLTWFCNLQFAFYRHTFQPYGEAGSLEKTELRYTWLRRTLKVYQERYANVFPAAWHAPCVLTVEFCKITRVHLQETLQETKKGESLQVAVLTQALTKTMDFEAEMADIFGDTARAIATADGQWTAVGGKDDVHGQLHEAPAPRDAVDEPAATTATAGGTDGPAPWTFKGAISGAFRGYLTLYVSLEDKAIKEGVRDLVAGETWKVAEDLKAGDKATRVLSSSADLFLLIKKALKRCIPVSTGETLHDLHKVWRAALCAYAAAITAKLPKLPPVATGWEPPAVHLSDEELALACTAVTTAEYCSTTSGELEASIQRSIDAAFADQVDMSEAQDAFQAVVTHAVKLLVADVETQLQSHLLAYTRTRWEALEGVAEESSQINSILRALGKVGEFWGAHLLPIYVRFTCDKLVASFMPRFVAMVLRCRRIGETGAQQLLLDLQALKSALYELPVSCGTTTTSAYTKLVTAEVAKAETLLRLVLTPEEALQEHFEELSSGCPGADLAKVLELKGAKKPEMAASVGSLLEDIKGGISTSTSQASLQGAQKFKKLLNIT